MGGSPASDIYPAIRGVAIFPFHSPSVTGNIRGGSLNRPSNTMAVGIRVAPLLALSCPLLFDIVRTTIWTRIHSDQNFTLAIARYRDITFVVSDKSTASLTRKSAMIIARERKGAIGLFGNSTSRLGNYTVFLL